MGMHTARHVGVDEIFKGIHNSGGGRNVLREAWSRAVSLLPSRPWEVARGALRLPSQNYGRWLCTAVDNTFGDAGIVDSDLRGGKPACAVAEPGLSLLGNNVQMEA